MTFRNNAGLGCSEIGRWLGVLHRVGQLMSYWILPASGFPISCTTVQRVTELEKKTDEFKDKMNQFNANVESRIGANVKSANIPQNELLNRLLPESIIDLEREDENFYDEFNKAINDPLLKEVDEEISNEFGHEDQYIGMKLSLPYGPDSELKHAQVKKRAINHEGNPIGKAHNNPLIEMRQYEVEFSDGDLENMTANLIAENTISRVDDAGHDKIEDHGVLECAIPRSEGTYLTKQGVKRRKRTNRGWDLLVRWKDGSSNWIPLKDLKASYPIKVMEYAIKNKI